MEDHAPPVDAAPVDRLHALAERAARVDDHRAAQPPRQRELRLERRPLKAERPRGLPRLLRQVESVQAALAQSHRGAGPRARPERREARDRSLPGAVHRAGVEADRVPDRLRVLAG